MKNVHEIRESVQEAYSKIAISGSTTPNGCCSGSKDEVCCSPQDSFDQQSLEIGYSSDDLKMVPKSSNLGLGSGNPVAFANLIDGEVVVDLGSGAGFDAFLASQKVGKKGKVVGVDMTPAMISKARKNASEAEATNVEFRLGEIEHLPLSNDFADVIISNCVINLSPEKQQVFNEAFRVLKQGGRLAISDPVSLIPIPESNKLNMDLYCACVTGASSINALTEMLQSAGFSDIRITPQKELPFANSSEKTDLNIAELVVSANIEATKP